MIPTNQVFKHRFGSDPRVRRNRDFYFYKTDRAFDGIDDDAIDCAINKLFTAERCEAYRKAHDRQFDVHIYTDPRLGDEVSFSHDGLDIFFLSRTSKEEISKFVEKGKFGTGVTFVRSCSTFCSRYYEVLIFRNESERATTVYVVRDRMRRGTSAEILSPLIHRIACCIGRIIPQFVGEITAEEKAFCEALQRPDLSLLQELCDAEYAKYDFRAIEIDEKMTGFTLAAGERMIQNLNEQIADTENDYRRTLDQVRDIQRLLEELNMRLTMYSSGSNDPNKEDAELVEYAKSLPGFNVLYKSNDRIYFCFVSPIDEFDPIAYRDFVTDCCSDRSYVFKHSPFSLDETKKLYDSIFVKHDFDLYIYATYSIDTEGYVVARTIDPQDHYVDVSHAIPNPHIVRHNCVGGYGSAFSDCGRRHDFIGALTVAAQSARCVNVGESVSAEYLFEAMFDSGKRCFKTKDGRWVNAEEAMEMVRNNAEA